MNIQDKRETVKAYVDFTVEIFTGLDPVEAMKTRDLLYTTLALWESQEALKMLGEVYGGGSSEPKSPPSSDTTEP
jgi:hypothetical protein